MTRRRLLYIVGVVPSILMLLLSARIALLLHHQEQALEAYESGDFDTAVEDFAANQVLNPIERWIAPFGEGDALYRLADFEAAVAAFERSLAVVPEEHECMVRVNLSLSHEAAGDAALEAGEASDAQDAWSRAVTALAHCVDQAREEIADDPTLDDNARRANRRTDSERGDGRPEGRGRDQDGQVQGGEPQDGSDGDRTAGSEGDDAQGNRSDDSEGQQDRWQAAAVRLDRRLDRKAGGDAPPVSEPAEAPPEDDSTREKKRRLEERNRQAHEDRVRHRDDFDNDAPPPPPPWEEEEQVPQW